MTECERLLREGFISDEFLKEEIRNEYTVSPQMKKVWAIELDLLNRISEVCKKHNLVYWMAYGSLLGTIRHKGFIPWDDDIDIWMPREDYNTLLNNYQNEFADPYFLQTPLNDPDYYCPFARLRNSNTTGISVSGNNNCNNGIYIDIMPLDGAPNSRIKRIWRLGVSKIRSILGHTYAFNHNPSFITKTVFKLLHSPLFHYSTQKAFSKCNRYAQRCRWGDSKYVGLMVYGILFSDRDIFEVKDFKETEYVDYEFLKVPIPKGFDSILKKRYGEYMQFPSPDQQGIWHSFDFSPDIPYKEYLAMNSKED